MCHSGVSNTDTWKSEHVQVEEDVPNFRIIEYTEEQAWWLNKCGMGIGK